MNLRKNNDIVKSGIIQYLLTRCQEFYINQFKNAKWSSSGNMTMDSAGSLLLQSSASGYVSCFENSSSGENRELRQHGYITADTAGKYIKWSINDTTDNFELTREDAYILSFDIQMPLITDGITASGDINPEADGTRDLGTQTTAQWANVWADLLNGSDYSYLNDWRMLESEKYEGYPEGIAFGNTGFVDGEITEVMPKDSKPVFVVTEEFIEYDGARLTPGGFKFLCWISNFIGKMFN